jgi:P27 family predicted phage terminase small subunit
MKIVNEDFKNTPEVKNQVGELPEFIDSLPVPPTYWNCVGRVKKIYREIGEQLLQTKKLQSFDKYALLMLAEALDEYLTMTDLIQVKEKKERGSGYIQTFKNGTTNVTTEQVVREKAFKRILQVSAKFGLTIRDRMALNMKTVDSGQLDIFAEFENLQAI